MKPFLLVSTRPEDEALDAEYQTFLKVTRLEESELEQLRLDMLGLPEVDVRDYRGVLVAGSPYGTTTPAARKSATQVRTEQELVHIFDDLRHHEVPCLTTGFGTEVAALTGGGVVSRKWREGPGMVDILLTPQGRHDPLLDGFPAEFHAYVDHREAVEEVPEGAVVLAGSISCPAQVIRLDRRIWATQFNPELDSDAINGRLQAFEDAGYPGTDDIESLLLVGRHGSCEHQAGQLVRNFLRMCTQGDFARRD
ncbi:glutamine amidotransferase [Schaalia sp. 19OD2882]|uniref:glutamine amidotransferase-related protein n=1 Tax=Schaalia sp. 19OD2882 TaxID=2794089 RepID=UPI001C1E8DD0|nr:glutamine amidotransferase [Schaalia sp. 19OD2882]QWW19731.1 glutamine amidotransferase [Schaalia sp. 19OD2882]